MTLILMISENLKMYVTGSFQVLPFQIYNSHIGPIQLRLAALIVKRKENTDPVIIITKILQELLLELGL